MWGAQVGAASATVSGSAGQGGAAGQAGQAAAARSRAMLLKIARAMVVALGGIVRALVPPLLFHSPDRPPVGVVEEASIADARLAGTKNSVDRMGDALGDANSLLDEALARCKALRPALDVLSDDLV